jgi:uncharacterized protein YndB with AHSA1/START domain
VGGADTRYALKTDWVLAAPVEQIFDVLMAPEQWPRWWRYVAAVVLVRRGNPEGVGAVHRYTWTSRLPYRLTFDMETTAIVRPWSIEGAARGELSGTGRWDLRGSPRGTSVQYTWQVTTGKAWMNALGPLLAPIFEWNHDQVMAEGARGIARYLGVPLRSFGRTSSRRAASRTTTRP